MTAQVTATPPGTTTIYETGARIPTEPGVIYQIADVADDGTLGPILDPQELERNPLGDDLKITLPDGTVLIFAGLIPILAQNAGGGLAGPGNELVIATLEQAVAPALGEETVAPQPANGEGGSSQAFNSFDPDAGPGVEPPQFGDAPEASFTQLGTTEFSVSETDPNLVLTLEDETTTNGAPPPGPPAPPSLLDDQVVTNFNEFFDIPAAALLRNDSGTDLVITSVDEPNGDVLLFAGSQTVRFFGFDGLGSFNSGTTGSFTYTVTDSAGQTGTATVSLFFDRTGPFDLDGIGPDPASSPGNNGQQIFIVDADDPGNAVTASGGGGSDYLLAVGPADAILQGGGGDDTLLGGDGDDTLLGGSGTDLLDGGPGADVIDAGLSTNNTERIVISDRADGVDTIINFDSVAPVHDVLDLDALFDDLEEDLGIALDTAARIARVDLDFAFDDTDLFIDQSLAGDGSDQVQIATLIDTSVSTFAVGAAETDDVFVGA